MKRALALLLLASGPMAAQIPRAEAVDPALAPDRANDQFQRGKNLYDSAQASTVLESRINYYQRAAQLFNDYLDAFPNHPNAEMAWWYLGNSYYQSGQIDDAKRCFSTLLNRFGQGKWAAAAAYTLAADYYNNGKYAFAAPLFERFAENAAKPEDGARGNYLAGTCYRLLGRDREASKSFNKVVEDPAGGLFAPQAKLALGHLALKAGNQEDALNRFEDVVAAANNPAKYRGEAALYAALTATKLGKTEISDKYLDLILRSPGMDEFRPDAQAALMENLFAKKQYREVVEIFRRSSLQGEGEREANRLMIAGRAYMRIKQYAEALQLFRDVEKQVKPETDLAFHAAYYRLLCFFQIEGRNVPEQVDAFLQLYRKARPGDSRIHTALMMKAESLFASNNIAEAAKVYSQIDAGAVSDKNRPGLLYQRGWCLSEAGDAQGAIRSLSDFIKKFPADPRVPSALAKRAKSYVDSGESTKAIVDFDKLTGPDVPVELKSFAWLESAHLRRTEANNAEMILRYKGLLESIKDLDPNLQAEANYWIGLGLVRTNAPKESVAYLEKARSLRPDAYSKHAGQLLALGYFAAQNPQKLAEEINLAIAGNYEGDIPDPAIQWSGMQSYNARDFTSAAKSLALVANPEEPRETPKEVWRYLAKSRLETGDAEGALAATNNVLEVEQDLGWKADGLLDRGRALFLLKRYPEARAAADEAAELQPQGRTSAGLRILSGDLYCQDKKLDLAGADYLNVILLHEDKDLKPLALAKYIQVLIDQGKTDEVEKYRQQLQNEFPNWKESGH